MTERTFFFVVFSGILLLALQFFNTMSRRAERVPAEIEPHESKKDSENLLGTGIVKSVDRSDPVLRDAGLEKIAVRITSKRISAVEEWQVIAPMAMAFEAGEHVNLMSYIHHPHPHSRSINTSVLTRQPKEKKQ